jgi:hypothetical protein
MAAVDPEPRTASAMVNRSVGYAYPWDYLGDPAAGQRAARLGLDSVALAASYHATRAGTPLHPRHRVVEVDSACYVPVRPDAWRGHRLVPPVPASDPDGTSFEAARRQLAGAGLPVEAWVVLTHNGTLGRAHPDLTVRNAFGDRYPYGLCPAGQDVQQYCLTLVREVLAAGSVSGIVLEACGPMGFDHAGRHEKTEFAGWDGVSRTLLSLCFCSACLHRYTAAGIDGERLLEVVRAGVDAGAGTVEERLGAALAAEVATVRTGVATKLRRLLVAAVRAADADLRVTVHGSDDPWSTGSFATVQPALGAGIDSVVASCWDVTAGGGRIRGLRALAPDVEVGAYLRLDRDWEGGEATDRRLADYLEAGMSELHLYHLGLLGRPGLAAMRAVVARARRLAVPDGR